MGIPPLGSVRFLYQKQNASFLKIHSTSKYVTARVAEFCIGF
jgi:hypothetical protein